MSIQKLFLKKSDYLGKTNNLDTINSYPDSDSTMKIKNFLLSIIIPVYNEENSIKNVINRIPNHNKIEIIVVDDGSTDNSVNKIKEIKNLDIKVIRHEKNQGYGAAILTGLKYTSGDIIVTMDSDGQHNPEEIPKLIKPILKNKADIVIGSRYLGKSNYRIPLYTRTGEFVICKILWLLFGQAVNNNQSGYRAFSRKCLIAFNDMIYTKFAFCTEILFKLLNRNYRITEVPIVLNPRQYGTSYVKLLRIIQSLSTCITFYSLKKFKLNKILPKVIIYKVYLVISQYLKNI